MIPSSEKTNGQVVMETLRPVFPNVKVKKVEDYCGFGGFSRHIELIIGNWAAGFPIEWWEESYEGREKERYKDCFQPKSNENPCSSQQDHVEEDAKAFREVLTAFQLGLSFSFIDGLKANDKAHETAINAHWIDNNNGTISCSHCHTWFNKDDRYYYMHYCPYCNEKMTEKEE